MTALGLHGATAVGCLFLAACSAGSSASGGPSTTAAGDSDASGVVTVARRDFQIRFRLDGRVAESPGVALLQAPQLDLRSELPSGAAVMPGDRVGRSVVAPELEAALEAGAAESLIDEAQLAELRSRAGDVVAPVAGRLSLDTSVPMVESPGLDVVAELTAVQDLRLRSMAFSGVAQVETIAGQRAVACEAVWSETEEREASDDAEHEITTAVHCRLPRRVETVAGLRARLDLDSAVVRDAVVVPSALIGYDADVDGYYVVIDDDGSRRVPVTVGVTDGAVRVITSELRVGEVLLWPEPDDADDPAGADG